MKKRYILLLLLVVVAVVFVGAGFTLLNSKDDIDSNVIVSSNKKLTVLADGIDLNDFEVQLQNSSGFPFEEFLVDSEDNSNGLSSGDVSTADESSKKVEICNLIVGDFLADDNVTDLEREAMRYNTKCLQYLVNSALEGQTIKLPAGVLYFSAGGENPRGMENYVIKLKSFVSIVGAGTDEGNVNNNTVLKPYADSGTIKYGLDMFYYNNLADYNNPVYLQEANFSDFIIDGEDVRGNQYNSSGKGFMINLYKDCHFKNIIVRNTDGTGFGMDNPINSSIVDCVAINCGKNATVDSVGASGFGIGTGYSNEESIYISNCRSIRNKKYGFFFEHQARFQPNVYKATKAEGFVVENSYASGNLYNYGGERSNDVISSNCKSDIEGDNNSYTRSFVNFSSDSRRVYFVESDFKYNLSDLNDDYKTAILWCLENDVISSSSNLKFGSEEKVFRKDAVLYLWRLMNRPGDVVIDSKQSSNINSVFKDVSNSSNYSVAVEWAYNNNVVSGMTNSTFVGENIITRGDFITMLWRLAGSPKVNNKISFTDVKESDYYYEAVNWAVYNKISTGYSSKLFGATDGCTKEQAAVFLYKYSKLDGALYNIKYNLMHGSLNDDNPISYRSGSDSFVLSNPSRNGYSFVGWKGSDNKTVSKSISINKNTIGNKVYYAMYNANKYTIEYDNNGGSGSMDSTTVIYDNHVVLRKNRFTKDGYVFAGWSEVKDGMVDYEDEEIVKNLKYANGSITLYAVWEKKKTFTNIFVGSSIFYEMHSVVGDIDNDIWSAKRGAGLDWLSHTGIPSVSSKIKTNSNLIIALSSNDLFNPDIVGNTKGNYKVLANNYINYLKANSSTWKEKGVDVYLISIGPINESKISSDRLVDRKTIENFNNLVKSKLEDEKNGLGFIKFVDIYSKFKDDVINNDLLRDDGTHGKALYYSKLYSFIKKKMGQTYVSTDKSLVNMMDVSANDSNYEAIKWAYDNAYMNPVTSSRFDGDSNITRGEAVVLLWKSRDLTYNWTTSKFKITDVDETSHQYSAVVWGVENNIVNGYTETVFAPDSWCSKKEFISFVFRNANKPVSSTFNEINGISKNDYSYNAINWAINEKIVNGENDFNDNITRGEALNILYNYYN